MKVKKRRKVKYVPKYVKENMSREEYIILPYRHLIKEKTEEGEEECIQSEIPSN